MSALSAVRDLDCVATLSPLVFDVSGAYVTGAAAVIRRVLYSITTRRGRLGYAPGRGVDIGDLANATLDDRGVAGWKTAILREARAVDFVRDAAVGLYLDDRTWIVVLTVALVDGAEYPLEVSIGAAGLALATIGDIVS